MCQRRKKPMAFLKNFGVKKLKAKIVLKNRYKQVGCGQGY